MTEPPSKHRVEWALGYAESGVPVLPLFPMRGGKCACGKGDCKSVGKHPIGALVPRGLKDATLDCETIRRWWASWPDANIGGRTGEGSRIIGLDKDPRNGGEESFRKLTEARGPLPATAPHARTGGGGDHYIFANPGGRVPSSHGFMPGLDLQADDAYLVLAPSGHRSGKGYSWLVPLNGSPLPLPPPWLLEAASSKPAEVRRVEVAGDRRLPHGRHRDTIRDMAASIAAKIGGLDEAGLIAAVTGAVAPLLDDLDTHSEEIRELSRSALGKFGKAEPAEPPMRRVQGGWAGPMIDLNTGLPVEEEPTRQPSAATRLVRLARQQAVLFHDATGECYATVRVGSHEETYRVKSTPIRRWLGRLLFEDSGSAAPSEALASAILSLEGAAQYDGPQIETHLRVAEHEGDLWIDLGDPEWRAVRVTASGWSVEAKAPVKFIRGRTTGAFPERVRGGALAELAPFLSASGPTDRHFVLGVGWVIGAFHPKGPYLVLFIHGEQGAGKSYGSRFLRELTDPASNALRSLPKNEHDLAVAARGSWVLAFDNASRVPDNLSDALCRISTGAGFATRELYTDGEEVIFDGKRPVLVNGIPVLAEAADLRDRALVVEWPVPPVKKKEKVLVAEFKKALPRLFGAVLDALVLAVRDESKMNPRSDLRMLDCAAWVMAAEPGLPWQVGTFEATYAESRSGLAVEAVTSSLLAEAVLKLAEEDRWEGTATRLLSELGRLAEPPVEQGKAAPEGWPKGAMALGNQLRRLIPDLRAVGVSVKFGSGGPRGKSRYIFIRRFPDSTGKSQSAASAPSAPGEESSRRPLEESVGKEVGLSATSAGSTSTADAADGADARILADSGAPRFWPEAAVREHFRRNDPDAVDWVGDRPRLAGATGYTEVELSEAFGALSGAGEIVQDPAGSGRFRLRSAPKEGA